MKRLHVHVSVKNIDDAVKFYTTMFGADPVKKKTDYAKWLLEDPRVNFAISTHGQKTGLDHLGIQVDEDSELSEVRDRIGKAELATFDEGETTCCYAKADKTWVMDPAGLPWEAYRTMGDAEIFNEVKMPTAKESACCPPTPKSSVEATKTVPTPPTKTGCCG